MTKELEGKRIAILVADGFEQVEMTSPRDALIGAGAAVDLISPAQGKVRAAKHAEKGDEFPVDVALLIANPNDYDGLVLPFGVMNPDTLRINKDAVKFIQSFVDAGKPILRPSAMDPGR